MKNSTLFALACSMLACAPIFSQDSLQLTSKDSIVQSSWVLGLGLNIVDDTATPFGERFLDIDETWNAVPYPSRISIGRFFKNGLGLEAIGTYNKYKVGKVIDGAINTASRDYYAIDGKISYDVNKLIGETGWFDPYVHVGAGYTSIGNVGRMTANTGFGFNTWFSDRWGLNFNTMGKWGIKEGSTKQIQHSAGIVYQFGIEKGLSKKGEEKLAMIEAAEKERQRIADSLANEQRIKDEAALAERLAQEKENARLAAELDAENQRKQGIKDAITALGNVYFNFDSSNLNKPYKRLLDELALILQENPTVTLKIGSHTDSRGPGKYNMWLSEKRMQHTITYLVEQKGIDGARLVGEAFGETQLVNECDGTIRCSEEKHRQNRRSAFEVVKF
ncbi:OmpA family protein [Maribacter polysiphoniae]|uniref:OmpA family protein n=1 Tax=Maribacter polysiphoniae TaxID=429344 RepID=A0A316DXI7_9FLAO|nr:OmpA family protein [Maribacter polysiphoniae]MBD1262792.1 OmpA family protein [Maribacter polysiphoniae]PWK21919.1 OmpA family protein [Maribacter polysiphoniae]